MTSKQLELFILLDNELASLNPAWVATYFAATANQFAVQLPQDQAQDYRAVLEQGKTNSRQRVQEIDRQFSRRTPGGFTEPVCTFSYSLEDMDALFALLKASVKGSPKVEPEYVF